MSIAEQAVQQLDRLSAIILEDGGDGPAPETFAAAASAARDAVGQLSVPALTQLSGLIAGIAQSLVAGAIEWNTSVGGTVMAAVDDLRHLAGRASQFTDEDSEHLAHRASELQPYVKADVGTLGRSEVGMGAPPSPENPTSQRPDVRTSQTSTAPTSIIPISDLFYSDAGPHIVSGGTPKEAEGKSDLLGRGIDALDTLTMKPIAKQVTFGAMEVVPVETLLYRGRAALERAAAIREQIKSSGGVASPAVLDEMYDLIGLALKD